MIREAFTAPGDWALGYHPDTPDAIRDLFDLDDHGFAHIVVTDTHLDAHTVTAAGLCTAATYRGVLRTHSTRAAHERRTPTIGGAGLAILLGDEDSKGNNFENTGTAASYPFWNGPTNNSWLKAAFDRANGLAAGTVPTPAASPTRNLEFEAGDTARKVLDTAGSIFGGTYRYWRVNPDGTIDVGTRAAIWASGEVVVIPGAAGRDGTLYGINPTGFGHDRDVEDWSSAVRVNPSGVTETGTATIGSNPYYDGATSSRGALTMRRYISSDSPASAGAAADIAATQLGRFDETRRELKITTDEYSLGAVVEPGDEIYVYDPTQDLLDLTNQVHYLGDVIFPLAIRVEAIRWPFRDGMGAYLLTGATPTVTDITPYVVPEDSDAEIEVGAFSRTLATAA